jgi:ribosomal protein S18 acetylase RimI-like enzyme
MRTIEHEVRIESFAPQDDAAIVTFVEAIQDYERRRVVDLKPGADIGRTYADQLMRNVADRRGFILMARAGEQTIGFLCAWIDEDHDILVREDARQHAYVSDIFVIEGWRRRGVAQALLRAAEDRMRERGCRRIRICSKAANITALKCYQTVGYQPYEIIFSKAIEGR